MMFARAGGDARKYNVSRGHMHSLMEADAEMDLMDIIGLSMIFFGSLIAVMDGRAMVGLLSPSLPITKMTVCATTIILEGFAIGIAARAYTRCSGHYTT